MKRNRTILIGCFGTYGEVLPFVRLSKQLVSNGILPVVLAPRTMESLFISAGAQFIAFDDPEEILNKGNPLLFTKQGSWGLLFARYIEPTVCRVYNQALSVIDMVKPDMVWASWIVPGLHLAALNKRVTVRRVCLHPLAAKPLNGPVLFDQDSYTLTKDAMLTPELDSICRQVAPTMVGREFLFPDVNIPRILLYPKPFGPQAVGDVYYLKDDLDEPLGELPQWVREFLKEGNPPVLISIGSVASNGNTELLETLGKAVVAAGFRAIIHTGLTDAPLRRGREWICGGNIPLRQLYPHLIGVIHHSGLGNSQETLHHGLPAISVPLAFDQYALAERLQRLGVALRIDRDLPFSELVDTCRTTFDVVSPIRQTAATWNGERLYAENIGLGDMLTKLELLP